MASMAGLVRIILNINTGYDNLQAFLQVVNNSTDVVIYTPAFSFSLFFCCS